MKKQFYAYLHTHWDLEWYRDIEDFNLRFLDVFDIVLSELKNNKAPFFYLDGQVVALLYYLKIRQEKKEEIKELIRNKKLAIGPYFVSADSYLVNFCSMLKNLELGKKISAQFNQKTLSAMLVIFLEFLNLYLVLLSLILLIKQSFGEALIQN